MAITEPLIGGTLLFRTKVGLNETRPQKATQQRLPSVPHPATAV